MELRLQKLIDNLITISKIQEIDSNNNIVVRLSNTIAARITVVVCSVAEPNHMVLPLNVAWLNVDTSSAYYKKILIRSSKANADGFFNTWEEAFYYNDVMGSVQYYDNADKLLLNEASTVGDASPTTKGIVQLSVAPSAANSPIAVGEGDPRLTDARTPTAHTHPLLPARAIKSASSVVTLDTAIAPAAGQVLMAINATSAHWVTLTASDIH